MKTDKLGYGVLRRFLYFVRGYTQQLIGTCLGTSARNVIMIIWSFNLNWLNHWTFEHNSVIPKFCS